MPTNHFAGPFEQLRQNLEIMGLQAATVRLDSKTCGLPG